MRKETQISKMLFDEAKRQYYSGEISLQEYNEILELIFNKLSVIENNQSSREYILKFLGTQNFKVNLKDTINYSLSMN